VAFGILVLAQILVSKPARLEEWLVDPMKRSLARRVLFWCVIGGVGLVGLTHAFAQLGNKLRSGEIRETMAQNTLSYTTVARGVAKAYLAPDGMLRGKLEGKQFDGSWTIRDDMLCLDFPGSDDDGCWSIFRLPDGQLQLFTKEGEPSGYIRITKGNPDSF